ncbi:hypothetical protein LguiA_027993 [Lonicera macranthoides]
MDSSKIFGGGSEECHSSESGWTTYICSPVHGGDDDDDEGDGNGYGYGHGHNDVYKDGSDDSLASDASSHPRHGDGKNHEGKHDEKFCSNKRGKKSVEKKCEERKKKNEEKVKVKDEINAPVQTGKKVRKNFWIGKRK